MPTLAKKQSSRRDSHSHHHKHQVDPVEKAMTDRVDVIDAEDEQKVVEIKKQLEKEGFFARLKPYNKPVINVWIGILVSII